MSDLVADTENKNELLLESAQGQRVLVRYTPAAFEVLEGENARPLLSTPPRNVLRISVARKSDGPADRVPVTITALALESGNLELWKRDYWIGSGSHEVAVAWSERVTSLCYDGVQRGRRVALLLNPIGGKGKARQLVKTIALPILEAAGLKVEVYETQHAKHGEMIAQDLPLDFDVIASASGDGLIHEVINGFAARADAKQALRIPIVQIPTGSANAFCLNSLGLENGFSIPLACLNVIKGRRIPLDICSLMQGSKRWFSYMSLAAGLMMEVDLKTEHLRWMGDARFVYGFIRGVFQNKAMKCRLHLKVVNADKALMIQNTNAKSQQGANTASPDEPTEGVVVPPPRDLQPDEEWLTIVSGEETPMSAGDLEKAKWKQGDGIWYIYTGMQPFVSRDLMQFPVAIPGEGLIDVVVQSNISRMQALGSIDGAPEGKPFYMDSMHYYKVSAYVLEPLEDGDLLSLDGEAIPFQRLSVEMIPKMATTMTLSGQWPVVESTGKSFKMKVQE